MYIKRHMEQLLEQITAQYPVLLVTGPRQVGKTTMLEHLAEKEGRGRGKDGPEDVLPAPQAPAAD